MKNDVRQDLFREEARRYAVSSRGDGTAFMPALPIKTVVVIVVVLFLALIGLLVFGKYSRNLDFSGVIEPAGGRVEIRAPMAGVVSSVFADEGAFVRQGEFIVKLEAPLMTRSGTETRGDVMRVLEIKESRIKDSIAGEKATHIRLTQNVGYQQTLIRAEVDHLQSEIKLQAARAKLATRSVGTYTKLMQVGFVSDLAVAPYQDRELELTSVSSSLQRTLSALKRDEIRLGQVIQEANQKTEQSVMDMGKQLDDIALEKIRLASESERVLVSPSAGRLLRRLVRKNDRIENGQLVAVIHPEPITFVARFAAPSASLAEVVIGQPARLSVFGYPIERYGYVKGTVVAISPAGIAAGDTLLTGGVDNQKGAALFQMDVAVDENELMKKHIPVRMGMQIQAEIQLRRQPIYKWMLAPFTVGLTKQFQ